MVQKNYAPVIKGRYEKVEQTQVQWLGFITITYRQVNHNHAEPLYKNIFLQDRYSWEQ